MFEFREYEDDEKLEYWKFMSSTVSIVMQIQGSPGQCRVGKRSKGARPSKKAK